MSLTRPRWLISFYVLAALAGGLFIALFPLSYSLTLLIGLAIVAASLCEPAIGLGGALIFGPGRAYLSAIGYEGPLFDPGQLFFALAFTGWLARSALQREIIVPRFAIFIPIAAFLGVGAISLFGAPAWRDGANELIKWIEIAIVIVITCAEARRGRLGWIVAAILIAGAFQAALGLWQYRLRGTGPESFELAEGIYRAYGTFEQPNPFGGFLGLIWPLAAGIALGNAAMAIRQPRSYRMIMLMAVCLALTGFILIALYASFSRGAWLGAAAAALAMAAFLPRRWWLGVGLVTAALVATWGLAAIHVLPASITARLANVTDFINVSDVRGVNINDDNFALVERLANWQAAQAMWQTQPWLGIGLGNYSARYADFSLLNWPNRLGHAHNIYLHTLAETGLLGLAAYGSLWLMLIILTLRATRMASGLTRGLIIGLLGVWAHWFAHQIVDNLHVNNMHLLLGAQIGMLHAIIFAGDNPLG